MGRILKIGKRERSDKQTLSVLKRCLIISLNGWSHSIIRRIEIKKAKFRKFSKINGNDVKIIGIGNSDPFIRV
ncbi:MAG: hypothetical protein IH946_11780 [Bacteroidetes bacterium]|nr:hypothetical protein [Bacteroidota bacterium]